MVRKSTRTLGTLLLVVSMGLRADGQPGQTDAGPLTPTHANVRYGPDELNVLDLFLAKTDAPAPLVLYIHGGGFSGGDKRTLLVKKRVSKEGRSFLAAGFSIAALNYRLTGTAPMPAAYLDCARALQFLRYHRKKWNLDGKLVASTGGSAGAGISLWLAFHDDLAEPKSEDPIARESTRLTCVAVDNGQASYDPRFAEQVGLPRPNFERHPFFLPFYGITQEEIDTPRAYALYAKGAPISYLSKDDPPTLMTYFEPDEKVDATSRIGLVIHHPRHGIGLKERMDAIGIECIVECPPREGDEIVRYGDGAPRIPTVDFIRRHFDAARAK